MLNGKAGPETEAVANAFGDTRIHVLTPPSTVRSKVAALNAAVPHTKGEWIALLDVDDRWRPTKLAEQVAAMRDDAAACTAVVLGTQAAYFGDMSGQPAIPVGPVPTTVLTTVNPLINSSVLIRRAYAHWEYPPQTVMQREVMEDYYLWMRIALAGDSATATATATATPAPFYNVPAVLVDHRIHTDSAFNSQHDSPVSLQQWFAATALQKPVTVLTTVCNAPHFLRIQHASLLRHMRVPWRFVAFNDAKTWPDATNFGDTTMRQQLEATCRDLGILHVPVANQHHQHVQSASHRHCDTLRAVMHWIRGNGNGNSNSNRYWMLDSDMWPIAPLEAVYLDNRFGGAGTFVRQERDGIVYAWPNLWWLDTAKTDVTELYWDLAPNCDTGGASAPWVASRAKTINWLAPHLSSGKWHSQHIPPSLSSVVVGGGGGGSGSGSGLRTFLAADPRNTPSAFWAELYDERLFHVRAGSNWNGEGQALHARLAELTLDCFLHEGAEPGIR